MSHMSEEELPQRKKIQFWLVPITTSCIFHDLHYGLKLQKLFEKSLVSVSSDCDRFFHILKNDTPIVISFSNPIT